MNTAEWQRTYTKQDLIDGVEEAKLGRLSRSDIARRRGIPVGTFLKACRDAGLKPPPKNKSDGRLPPSQPAMAATARSRRANPAGAAAALIAKAKELPERVAPMPLPRAEDDALAPTYDQDGLPPAALCKWPYGNGPFKFCGRERQGEGVYCATHKAQASAKRRAA